MNKKNVLGMDMTEWKHLSGLADPYTLALAEAGAEAGVPPIVEKKSELTESDPEFSLKHFEKHYQEPSDDEPEVIKVPKALHGRSGKMKTAARMELLKARTPVHKEVTGIRKLKKGEPTKLSDYNEKQRERIMRKAAAKKTEGEDITMDDIWAAFLEDRGSSVEEFESLLNLAIESEDEDLTVELIAIEDQLDELLGTVGEAYGFPAGSAVKPVKPGVPPAGGGGAYGFAPGAAVKPGAIPAGGGAPAGATPPAGAPPAGPAGAAPQAAPAAPATAATPAAAPTTGSPAGAPRKIGLLGTLGRGIAKVGAGAVAAMKPQIPQTKPMATPAPAAGVQPPVAPTVKPKKEDVEAWEEFVSEEFGITAEQYVEMFDRAIAEDDQEILGSTNQIDEIFAAWRAKKAAAAQEKHQQTLKGWQAAREVVAKHGAGATKAASVRGKQVGAPPAGSGTSVYAKKESIEGIAEQIMESSARPARVKPENLKDLIGDQLKFSGYTDEHISRKSKAG